MTADRTHEYQQSSTSVQLDPKVSLYPKKLLFAWTAAPFAVVMSSASFGVSYFMGLQFSTKGLAAVVVERKMKMFAEELMEEKKNIKIEF